MPKKNLSKLESWEGHKFMENFNEIIIKRTKTVESVKKEMGKFFKNKK